MAPSAPSPLQLTAPLWSCTCISLPTSSRSRKRESGVALMAFLEERLKLVVLVLLRGETLVAGMKHLKEMQEHSVL
ncbi:hypothetical protein HN51_019620 [Arachis hypogaea]